MVASGETFLHAGVSLARVTVAWLLSAAIAIPLGSAMGRLLRLEKLILPVIELLRSISPLEWTPLAFLWFGISEFGETIIVFISIIFPILMATISDAKSIDPLLIQADQVLIGMIVIDVLGVYFDAFFRRLSRQFYWNAYAHGRFYKRHQPWQSHLD